MKTGGLQRARMLGAAAGAVLMLTGAAFAQPPDARSPPRPLRAADPLTERINNELRHNTPPHYVEAKDIDTTRKYVDTIDTPAHPERDSLVRLDPATTRRLAGILLEEVCAVRREERERLMGQQDSIRRELRGGKSAATGRRLSAAQKAERQKELKRLSRGIRGLRAMPVRDARLEAAARQFADTVAFAKRKEINPPGWTPVGKMHEFGRPKGGRPSISNQFEVWDEVLAFDTRGYDSFDKADLEYEARLAVRGLLTSILHRPIVLSWREEDYPAGAALSVTAIQIWDHENGGVINLIRFNTCIQSGLEKGQTMFAQW